MQQKRYIQEQVEKTGITILRTSCTRALRSSGVEAVAVVVPVQACSARTAAVVVAAATATGSAWCSVVPHFKTCAQTPFQKT